MAKIIISNDYEAIVDEDDLDIVAGYSWYIIKSASKKTGIEKAYAVTRINNKTVYMHRLILNAPKGTYVDHKDNDGLNNTRDNIRLATQSQNLGNSVSKGGTSKYKGVYWNQQKGYPSDRGLWTAILSLPGGKNIKKYFHSEEDAARKYNEMAIEHFGEFAKLNEVI